MNCSQSTTIPRILTFADYYLPGYKAGGPIQTIANIVETLGDRYCFSIVTSDRDWSDEKPYRGVTIDGWNRIGKARVFYLSRKHQNWRGISKLLQSDDYDLLYLNSFCSRRFSILPLLINALMLRWKMPVLLAPRGELSTVAFRSKATRKAMYRSFLNHTGLAARCHWHVSSADEKRDLLATLNVRESLVYVAPDLPGCECVETPSCTKRTGDLKIAFLARICAIKNLDGALRMLSRVKGTVHFSIYGIIDDQAYWHKCEEVIRELPENIHVSFRGGLQRHEVIKTLAENDVFFFPTKSENYGHVIHEALRAGLPVVISDRTPWHDVERNGAGWECRFECEDDFVQKLQACVAMSAEELLAQKVNAVKYGKAVSEKAEVVESNRAMFEQMFKRALSDA